MPRRCFSLCGLLGSCEPPSRNCGANEAGISESPAALDFVMQLCLGRVAKWTVPADCVAGEDFTELG